MPWDYMVCVCRWKILIYTLHRAGTLSTMTENNKIERIGHPGRGETLGDAFQRWKAGGVGTDQVCAARVREGSAIEARETFWPCWMQKWNWRVGEKKQKNQLSHIDRGAREVV